jgi:hypothetical protein
MLISDIFTVLKLDKNVVKFSNAYKVTLDFF